MRRPEEAQEVKDPKDPMNMPPHGTEVHTLELCGPDMLLSPIIVGSLPILLIML